MSTEIQFPVPRRHAAGQSRTAIRFFLLASAAFGSAAAIAGALAQWCGRPAVRIGFAVPPAFAVSSVLLILGSISLTKAVAAVRREHQHEFRHWLTIALAAGACFMGVQAYGLWWLLPEQRAAGDASLGATPFVLMFAALHALHLSVAVLFLAFVSMRAYADRYDHEYYWGVSICAWFWHALGIAWVFILVVLGIAALTGSP